jgi:hypothetical protein
LPGNPIPAGGGGCGGSDWASAAEATSANTIVKLGMRNMIPLSGHSARFSDTTLWHVSIRDGSLTERGGCGTLAQSRETAINLAAKGG